MVTKLQRFLFLFLFPFMLPASLPAQEQGQFLGAVRVEHPAWFKESFLDISEDIAEAREEQKRLAVYFYQDGCPYCAKLIRENFTDPGLLAQLRSNFDLVAINIFGDVEVTDTDGEVLTEKTYAQKHRIQFTPTVAFYDTNGTLKMRINGYRSIAKFRTVMDYVIDDRTAGKPFADYVEERKIAVAGKPMPGAEWFMPPPYDLARADTPASRPLAVFFESDSCDDCIRYHADGLADPEVISRLERMDVVQLDVNGETPVVSPDGRKFAADGWARELNITYIPSIVFFDEGGAEVFRTNGMLKAFHTEASLEYVLRRAYLEQPDFQRFLEHYADEIRATGQDVNIWDD